MHTTDSGFLVVADDVPADAGPKSRLHEEIRAVRANLNVEEQHRNDEVNRIRGEITEARERIAAIDANIRTLEAEKTSLTETVSGLSGRVETLTAAADDVEQLHRDLLGALYAATDVDAHRWREMVAAFDSWHAELTTAGSGFDADKVAEAHAQVADAMPTRTWCRSSRNRCGP